MKKENQERIYENYRKVYYYQEENDYISYRIFNPKPGPWQFMKFKSKQAAELYFRKEI